MNTKDALVNVENGQVITESAVNVDDDYELGEKQMLESVKGWPGTFPDPETHSSW